MSGPSLEVHVPISPNPQFLLMLRCLVATFRSSGGLYSDARFVVTIGEEKIDDASIRANNPWLTELNVETRWVPADLFSRYSYYATAMERFTYDFTADMVLMLDADMLIVAPIDDIVESLERKQKFGAVVAHATPFEDVQWQATFDQCGLGHFHGIEQYTGWPYLCGSQSPRYGPPYFNLGFLLMPRHIASQIGSKIYELTNLVHSKNDTNYRIQIAVCLAILTMGIPYECLPLRYNFPNDRHLEALHPAEQLAVRVIHLLRDHQGVWKETLFGERAAVEAFLHRDDLAGINLAAQTAVRRISAQGLLS